MKRPPMVISSQNARKMRTFEETANELFLLNTQVGTNNSHELWVKVKRPKTSFGCAVRWDTDCAGLMASSKKKKKMKTQTKQNH